MWVVKLGGSLQSSSSLRDWTELIGREGGGKIVLVPGGGRFADAVRTVQRELRFDDRTAHVLALLAMEQFGAVLASFAPELVPTQSKPEIQDVLARGRVPVWMPHALVSLSADIVSDWSFTSDSLSLWLARLLEAETLLLVKSIAMPRPDATPEELSTAGMIDSAFPALARGYQGHIAWLVRDQTERLRAALRSDSLAELPQMAGLKRETTPRAAARGAS